MSIIYALNLVFYFPSLLKTNNFLIKSKFFLPISEDTGPNTMSNKVALVSKVDEVVVDV